MKNPMKMIPIPLLALLVLTSAAWASPGSLLTPLLQEKFQDPGQIDDLVIPLDGFDLILHQVERPTVLDADSIAPLDTLTLMLTSDLVGDMVGVAAPDRFSVVLHEPVEVTLHERITVGFFLSEWATCSYFPAYDMPTEDTGWIELGDSGDGFRRIIPQGEVFRKPDMPPEAWEEINSFAEGYEASSLLVSEDILQWDYMVESTSPEGDVRVRIIEFLNRPSG